MTTEGSCTISAHSEAVVADSSILERRRMQGWPVASFGDVLLPHTRRRRDHANRAADHRSDAHAPVRAALHDSGGDARGLAVSMAQTGRCSPRAAAGSARKAPVPCSAPTAWVARSAPGLLVAWGWMVCFRAQGVSGPGLAWWTEMTLQRMGAGVPICASSLRWSLAWGFSRIAWNASMVSHWA